MSSFYLILYYYSLNFVINSWTFSTAHLDYSTGFVRRGLFGEIMNFFNTYLNFKNEFFFSFYYIFFTSINLILFFTLIKNFTNLKIIFIFLLFNPALFLFQINDPFAFQRGETTIITLMGLNPLHQKWNALNIIASSYQAVSGSGAQGIKELKSQISAIHEGKEIETNVYRGRIWGPNHSITWA